MRIGPLRKQIVLKSRGIEADTYGGQTETFTTYATVWGSINPISGSEIITAQQQSGEITHKVIVRYNSSISITDRVYYGSRVLEILFVRNIQERNHYIELLCKEIV